MVFREVRDTGNIRRFLYNGFLLTAVALIIRTVGVSFNVFITSSVGAEGTGLYQLVMSVYSPALTLATAGVSLSSSRLVAEELGKRRNGRYFSIFIRCLAYALFASIPMGALLFLIAPSVSQSWIGNKGAASLLRILSIGLPFVSLSSCISGFFTAVRRASKSAFLQLCEQLFRIFLTYAVITETGASGIRCLTAVVFGNVCSDILSFILSVFLCRGVLRKMRKERNVIREPMTARVLKITLPVSFSSFLRSALVALEHILIPKGLKKSGADYTSAMASYGTLTGMAMPIILFPASFLYSFSSLTIPELAEAKEMGRQDEIRSSITRILYAFLVFSVGASGIIAGFCDVLSISIYNVRSVTPFLLVLAPLIPFMYLDSAVDSMLKGLGEQIYTMKINVIDAASSVIAVTVLVPKMGIMGYVAVILISELINFSFSFYRLKRVTGVKTRFLSKIPKLLFCILGAVAVSRLLCTASISAKASAIFGVSSSVILYAVFLLVFNAVKMPQAVILFISDKVIKPLREKYNAKKRKGQGENADNRNNDPASAQNT